MKQVSLGEFEDPALLKQLDAALCLLPVELTGISEMLVPTVKMKIERIASEIIAERLDRETAH